MSIIRNVVTLRQKRIFFKESNIEAQCKVYQLQSAIKDIQTNMTSLQSSLDTATFSKIHIRKMIDCHANVWSRREELFDHYEKLCQRKIVIQQVLNDLKIKKDILDNEKKRCADRSEHFY